MITYRTSIALAMISFLYIPVLAENPDARVRQLAFVSEEYLTLSIGKYDPGEGWLQSTDYYTTLLSSETFTLFGVHGRMGEISLVGTHREDSWIEPVLWSAKTNRGPAADPPFALAVRGSWPEERGARDIPLENADAERIARDYLRRRGLRVENPLLTQAYQADLLGDGRLETLVCAHSDPSALKDDQAGDVYAVSLLNFGPAGSEKTIALRSQTSHKPAAQTREVHEGFYGKRDFLRVIACHDIDGEGRQEIVLYAAQDDATQIDVFTFDGHTIKKVLSAFKHHYN